MLRRWPPHARENLPQRRHTIRGLNEWAGQRFLWRQASQRWTCLECFFAAAVRWLRVDSALDDVQSWLVWDSSTAARELTSLG